MTSTGRRKRKREIRIGQLVPRTGEDTLPLSRWLEQRPLFKHKVGVIDQAESLTVNAANAFLKMLEEPPSYASIILIAPSPQAILPTLASRCTVVRFGTVNTEGYRNLAPHPDLRLGRIGKLETAQADLDNFRELQSQVHDFMVGLSKDLATSLEAAETLRKAWDNSEEAQFSDLLREELRKLPSPLYARADDALTRFEDALSAYVSAELAAAALTLELRRLLPSSGYKAA
jgi:DNA polymerase III delta prime subunit